MRRWLSTLLAAAALAAACPAAGQPAAPKAAAAVQSRSEALVRRYLKAIQFEQLMDSMMASMLPLMADDLSREHPNITAQEKQQIGEVVREVMREKMTPAMIDRMVPIYAQTFSESELQAIVAFYESPAGQAIVSKSPSLAPKSAEVARQLIPQMQVEILQRFCSRFDCAGKTPPATPRT